MPQDTILCWKTKQTVADYQAMVKQEDRSKISNFIRDRFTERFISPLLGSKKNGFCTMAICCLMIETLESFWRGWGNTRGKEQVAFYYFFGRNDNFLAFRPFSETFYKNIRCGILHQGETTGGWRILGANTEPLLNSKTINATKFHKELEHCLNEYCAMLEVEDWNSERWIKFRNKMDVVCKNCD